MQSTYKDCSKKPCKWSRFGGLRYLWAMEYPQRFGQKLLSLPYPVVMGIVNLTPDSFFAPSRTSPSEVVDRAGTMLDEGAYLLDLGGASSRPGGAAVSEQEEAERLLPALEAVAKAFPEALLSADTTSETLALAALKAGASVVNDVSGLSNPGLASVSAAHGAPYVLMHNLDPVGQMRTSMNVDHPMEHLLKWFAEKLEALRLMGVSDVWLDPGFGFGKSLSDNLNLLKNLRQLAVFECPILVGVSRKRMVQHLGNTDAAGSLPAGLAVQTLALTQGAHIIRTHDVAATHQTLNVFRAWQQA